MKESYTVIVFTQGPNPETLKYRNVRDAAGLIRFLARQNKKVHYINFYNKAREFVRREYAENLV